MEERSNNVSALGIVSFILGILSIIWPWFIPGGALVGVIVAIVAIILACVSRGKNGLNGWSTAGLILGIIGIIIFIMCLGVAIIIDDVDMGILFLNLLFM